MECGKVNCQDFPTLCQQAGVRAYPTLKFYKPPSSNTRGEDIRQTNMDFVLSFLDRNLKTTFIRDEL